MSVVFLWCVVDNGNRHARFEQLVADGADRDVAVKAVAGQRWDRVDRLVPIGHAVASALP